jgi:uncharacterized membrane protein
MLSSRVRGRFVALRDGLRTQIWALPTLGVLLGLALGVVLPRIEAHSGTLPGSVSTYLFGGGPSAARTFLGAIAGSLVTVTSLTFSLTVVTLQLASSQFSPRLLRTFTSDRFVHATLALFLATFTYALAVLRTVRDETDDEPPFVPPIAVTLAFLLTVASVLGLVLFLAHLAREIRVETMLRRVHGDAEDTLRRVLVPLGEGSGPASTPTPPAGAAPVQAAASGFLLQVDEAAVLDAAVRADAIVRLGAMPGDLIVARVPVGFAWTRTGREDPDALDRLREEVVRAISSGFERTATQDVAYGLRQLVDVAVKALSPGINDPTTAVHALGHISALLCELAAHELGPRTLHDDEGQLRAVLHRPDLDDLVELALEQPRLYGAADPLVLGRMFGVLRELAWRVQAPAHRRTVTVQLARLRASAAQQDFDAAEHERMERLARLVDEAAAQRWPIGDAA